MAVAALGVGRGLFQADVSTLRRSRTVYKVKCTENIYGKADRVSTAGLLSLGT